MIIGDILYGDDVPQRQMAGIPESGQTAMDSMVQEANKPIEQEYGKIGQDMDIGRSTFGLLNTDSAIKQKYKNILEGELGSAEKNLRLNARDTQLSNMKRAQTAMIAKTRIQNDIFAQNMEYQSMKEAARAQALSSILGFAGGMAGMAAAKKYEDRHPFKSANVVYGGAYGGVPTPENIAGRNQSLNYNERLLGITEGQGVSSIGGF